MKYNFKFLKQIINNIIGWHDSLSFSHISIFKIIHETYRTIIKVDSSPVCTEIPKHIYESIIVSSFKNFHQTIHVVNHKLYEITFKNNNKNIIEMKKKEEDKNQCCCSCSCFSPEFLINIYENDFSIFTHSNNYT